MGSFAIKAQNNKPDAAYDYQILSLCDTILIQFYDRTDSTSTNWLWNFPEGTPSTSRDQNPLIAFENYGAYTVSLVVTNPAGTDVLYEANAVTVAENTLPVPLPDEVFKCAEKPFTLNIPEHPHFQYKWMPDESIVDPTILNSTFSNTTPTQYALTIVDEQFGCSFTGKTLVNVHSPIKLIMGETQEICRGDSVELSASTNANLIDINWLQTDSLQNSQSLTPIAAPYNTITYTLNVIDINGCEESGTQTIEVTTNNLKVSAGEDVSICKGSSVSLSANAGSTFSWSPGISLNDSTNQNIIASPLETTTYVLSASTQFCSGTDSITIFVLEAPESDYPESFSICVGDSVQLSNSLSNENYSYYWSPYSNINDLFISEPFVYPIQTVDYSVVITNDSGCTDTIYTTINVLEQAVLETSIDTTICIGDTIQLFANGGTDYNWSPVGTLSDPTAEMTSAFPTQSTVYTVTSSIGSCEAKGEVTIYVQSPLDLNLGADVSICNGASIELSATVGQNFSWSPGYSLSDSTAQTVIAQPDSTTTYILQASDQLCASLDSITVQVVDKPESAYQENYAFCKGDSIILSNTLSNPSYSYGWFPATDISNPYISEPTVYPSQSEIYRVVITDGNLCIDTVEVLVETVEQIALQVSMDTTICAGDTIQLKAKGGVNYAWSPAGSLTNPEDSTTLAFPTQSITYTVSSAAGNCSASADIVIGVYPSPEVFAGEDIYVCQGDEMQILAEGEGSYPFTWQPEMGLSNPTIANPFFGDTISTEYIVSRINEFGCMGTDTIFVEVKDLPELNVSPNFPTICRDGAIPLTASGATEYEWLPAATLSSNMGTSVIASPTQPTTYTLAGTDEWGCRSSYFITVDIIDSLNLTVLADTIRGCIDAPVLLAAYGAETFFWSPSDHLNTTAGDSVYLNYNQIDTLYYSVTGTDFTDCTAVRDVVVITSSKNAVLSVGKDVEVCKGDSILLEATGLERYIWSPEEEVSSPTESSTYVQPVENQIYQLNGFDFGGCLYSAEVEVSVNDLPETSLNYKLVDFCRGESVDIEAKGGLTYYWSPITGITEGERTQATINTSTSENITYYVDITDDNNCMITDSVRVIVNDCLVDYKSLVPTAFSPNQDNYNEVWQLADPAFRDFHNDLTIAIFNRWGQLLFEDKGSKWQWDGIYNDEALPEATYYYQLKLNDELPQIHGTVTLLR